MYTALFFSILVATVVGPWLFIFFFSPAPFETLDGGATHMQYWLLGSVVLGIGGIGAWLGFDRQRDIAQHHHHRWVATMRPVVMIRRQSPPTLRSARKARLRVVGGTAFRPQRPRM